MGLALLSLWRRKPRETLDGTLQPTRRELLTIYPPKVAPLDELLTGPHPRRAVDYWHRAMAILAEKGVLDKSGEAALLPSQVVLPRKGWSEAWCLQQVALSPGSALKEAVERCARNLPILSPRDLGKPRRKRGCSPKNPPAES